jgi:hypothetical protein
VEKTITELCGREGKRVFLIVPKKNLDIKMDKLASLLANLKNFNVKVKASMGITFTDPANNRTISILKSGIMIADNFDDEGKVYDFYREILVDGLGISASEIEL